MTQQSDWVSIHARRHELAGAVGRAIARERWCRLPGTKAFGDRLRDDIEILENAAASAYWFAEKPPSTGDIQHNRGKREEMIEIATEIEAGIAGKLVSAALADAEKYEDELLAREGALFAGERPDYRALGELLADGLSAEAIIVPAPGTDIAVVATGGSEIAVQPKKRGKK